MFHTCAQTVCERKNNGWEIKAEEDSEAGEGEGLFQDRVRR